MDERIAIVQPRQQGKTELAERIQARRQHIHDLARCESCGADRKTCDYLRRTNTDPTAPPWLGCCAQFSTMVPCRHRDSREMLDQLLREVADGYVRTVDEAYPPPVLGPHWVSMTWLLEQDEWWYPQLPRGPVRIAEMDKPWRWNVARFLERRAPRLERADAARGIWADAPDDVWVSLEQRTAQEFIEETPLYRALTRGLPPVDSRRGRLLAARAVHWHTCPMRLAHPAPSDHCLCIRQGDRVIGASNDPATVRA